MKVCVDFLKKSNLISYSQMSDIRGRANIHILVQVDISILHISFIGYHTFLIIIIFVYGAKLCEHGCVAIFNFY